MAKPFLKLTTKDFLSGIAPGGAHQGTGGLFFKADGITPLYEAGSNQSVNNGLLMGGASATSVAGTQNGNFLCSCVSPLGSAQYAAFFGTSTGHFMKLILNSTVSNSFTDLNTSSGAITSMEPMTSSSGGLYVFYGLSGGVGKYNLAGGFDDVWNPTTAGVSGISTDYIRAMHRFYDRLYFGNFSKVGSIVSDGAGDFTPNNNVLDFTNDMITTDISDDSVYLVVAVTNNLACDPAVMADTRIMYWDTQSSSWQREYKIPDPFIFALEHTPLGVFAFGVTGIWQVFFGSEPKKVFAHPPGLYSVTTQTALLYGRGAASHFADALLWGGSSGSNYAIKTLGKLDQSAPNAYLHPFLTTAGKDITMVNGQIVKGYVLVGDTAPSLKAYPFSTANAPQTGLTAQTVYFPLPSKTSVERIDLLFGEPLASGDSVSVSIYRDEDTAATSFGSATFAADGAIRRKQLGKGLVNVVAEEQLSILITFNAGAVKIKGVEVYGSAMEP